MLQKLAPASELLLVRYSRARTVKIFTRPLHLLLIVLLVTPFISAAVEPQITGTTLIRLDDVQRLSGGQTLVLDSDRNLFVRTVRAGKEHCYHMKLPAGELTIILAFIPTSGIAQYREHKRYGVPDEAHPAITLTLPTQTKLHAEKWANDQDPHFDKLYQRLLQLVERAAKTRAYRVRQYDPTSEYPGNA